MPATASTKAIATQPALRIRRCRCCGAEWDLDSCDCDFRCLRGCGRCERHCKGHADSDLLFDMQRDRDDDYDRLLEDVA